MFIERQNLAGPVLKEIVLDASRALAQLDADRLEELAHCCQELNREHGRADSSGRARLMDDARNSQREIALLASVLEATRANLRVLHHLRALRAGQAEYTPNVGRPTN